MKAQPRKTKSAFRPKAALQAVNELLEHSAEQARQSFAADARATAGYPRNYAALRLAYAFRNMTAHGALSATKSREFGFLPPIEALTDLLGQVGASIFERLAEEEPATTENNPQ